jgi:hypothetical protein
VQTANIQTVDNESSDFQRALTPAIPLYFFRDLVLREQFGFVPMLGHSAMIRKSAWEAHEKGFPEVVSKGFPEVVSEDYAFAMRAASAQRSGVFLAEPVGTERIPYDFGGFMLRIRKYAIGTAGLFRQEILGFLTGRAHPVEKWDALLQLMWYLLMPLVTLNGFLSAYVLYWLWKGELPYLHVILPYIYAWTLFVLLSLYFSVSGSVMKAVRFYFWSTAIHAAAMPSAGFTFIGHLVRYRPSFNRTPKNGERHGVGTVPSVLMTILGLAAVAVATRWRSPFSWVLAGQGVAYSSYWLYGELCCSSIYGWLARNIIIYVPGSLMLIGLVYAIWKGAGLALW